MQGTWVWSLVGELRLLQGRANSDSMLELFLWLAFHCCCYYACVLSLYSRVWLFVTPWTGIARQAPLSMGILQARMWVRLPCPPLGHIPDPGIKHKSRVFPALTGRFFTAITTHNHNNGQPQRTPPFNLTVRLRSFVQLTGRWPDQPTCECLQEITTEGQLSWRCFARLRPLLLYFLTISLSPAFFF